jgi:hypothetical protein
MSVLRLETISLDDFYYALAGYPYIAPASLKDVDALRYDVIPAQIASTPGGGRLNKSSLKSLVEWKLCVCLLFTSHSKSDSRSKHGTFRPSLLALVSSNTDDLVGESTSAAYKMMKNKDMTYDEEQNSFGYKGVAVTAMGILTKLHGVGPATASLILSAGEPDWCPFFSDELYRWCFWGEEERKGKGRGWKRKIGYTVKEYKELFEKVWEIRERLGVNAVEVEKVAWVLGRKGVDLDTDDCWLEIKEELENMKEELAIKDRELEDKEKELEDKEKELDAMEEDLDAMEEELAAKDRELTQDPKQGVKQEIKRELKRELKQELKKELKQEVKKEAKKEAKKEGVESEVQKKKSKGTKRKVEDASLPAPGTRRSTRNKK